jgi:hypothetical protein
MKPKTLSWKGLEPSFEGRGGFTRLSEIEKEGREAQLDGENLSQFMAPNNFQIVPLGNNIGNHYEEGHIFYLSFLQFIIFYESANTPD